MLCPLEALGGVNQAIISLVMLSHTGEENMDGNSNIVSGLRSCFPSADHNLKLITATCLQ